MITLYGIRNCDTVKKARKWLEQHQLPHTFVDYKKTPPDTQLLEAWCQHVDWQTLLNRRGTTWRKLDDNDKQDVDQNKAIQLMCDQPSLIKRPVWDIDGSIHVGFSESADYLKSCIRPGSIGATD